jgi:hypothetical protein
MGRRLLYLLAFTAFESRAAEAVLLSLYTHFQKEPPAAVRTAVQEELDAIMSPIGWNIEWRALTGAGGREWSAHLAIARFRGECDGGGAVSERMHPKALGLTHLSDGKVIPFSVIDCNGVRLLLVPLLDGLDASRREFVFGRALGRVLAHELFHIITKSTRHGSKGLGRASFTPQELTVEHFRFNASDARKLRVHLLLALLQSTDWMAAPESGSRLSIFTTAGCRGCHGADVQGALGGPAVTSSAGVAAWFRSRFSQIRQRAARLKLPWSRITPAEHEALALYLERLRNTSDSRASISSKEPVVE